MLILLIWKLNQIQIQNFTVVCVFSSYYTILFYKQKKIILNN